MRQTVGMVIVAAALATAGLSAQSRSAVDPEIQKASAAFVAAFNAKDAARLASLYAADGVVMPPGAPMARGPRAIQAMFQQQMDAGVTLKLEPMAGSIAGGIGYEAGTSTVTIGGANGRPAVTSHGKYVVVYRKVNGQWKMAYDIFNDDQATSRP